MAKRRFEISIETDGMDYRKDAEGVAEAIAQALPDILRKFYRVTGGIKVKQRTFGMDKW